MADGREYIEEAYKIILSVSDKMGDLKGTYPEDVWAGFESFMGSGLKWAKLCRGKVWLRSAEGTRLAEGCLAAAKQLQASLNDPAAASDAAVDLSSQLEALAKIIATKSQVIT